MCCVHAVRSTRFVHSRTAGGAFHSSQRAFSFYKELFRSAQRADRFVAISGRSRSSAVVEAILAESAKRASQVTSLCVRCFLFLFLPGKTATQGICLLLLALLMYAIILFAIRPGISNKAVLRPALSPRRSPQ